MFARQAPSGASMLHRIGQQAATATMATAEAAKLSTATLATRAAALAARNNIVYNSHSSHGRYSTGSTVVGTETMLAAAQRLARAAKETAVAMSSRQPSDAVIAARVEFEKELENVRRLSTKYSRNGLHLYSQLHANVLSSGGLRSYSTLGAPQEAPKSSGLQATASNSNDLQARVKALKADIDDDYEDETAFINAPLTWKQLVQPGLFPVYMWALDEAIGIATRARYYQARIFLERLLSKEEKKEGEELSESEKKLQEEAKKMKKVWAEIRKEVKTGGTGSGSGKRGRLDPERDKRDRDHGKKDEKEGGGEDEEGDIKVPKNTVFMVIGFCLAFWLISNAISIMHDERLSLVTRKEIKDLLASGRTHSVHVQGTTAEIRLNRAPPVDKMTEATQNAAPYAGLKPPPQPTPEQIAAQEAAKQAAREAVAAAGSPNVVEPPAAPKSLTATEGTSGANAAEIQRQEQRKEALNKYLQGDRVYFGVPSADGAQRMIRDMCQELGIEDPPMVFEEPSVLGPIIAQFAIFGLLFFAASRFFAGLKPGSGPFSSMKRNFKAATRPNVTFKDVAGLDQAKMEIMEFVDFLANPHKYRALGAKLPKGALLVGPPGTGKTLLAKATAGEAKVPFFSVSGSDFQEMFVGVGSARVRELFKEARKSAPSIIFIDEIDAIGRARARGGTPSHEERENTLNAMLVEMDGFNPSENVVVLAGTNRAELLDKALTRPGRFDRQIAIDPPDIKGRVEIFKVHLKPLKLALDAEEVATKMAALTPGMVGADIANVCNEAALVAARQNKDAIELVDFEKAVDRIIGGLEKNSNILTPEERKLVAYHEAGHAICGWFLEHADPLLKVTIIPRAGGALGFAQYLPKEISLYRVRQFNDRICMALGGRAAEQVCFGEISSGASDDIKRTMRMAQVMVARLGMSPELANLCLENEDAQSFTKPFSESTAEVVDAEVKKIIDVQYERAVKLLSEKKDLLEKLGAALLEKETLNHDELVAILGPRPFKTDAYLKYMEIQREEKAKREAAAKQKEQEKEQEKENEKEKEQPKDDDKNKAEQPKQE